jgi:hypothetical protein
LRQVRSRAPGGGGGDSALGAITLTPTLGIKRVNILERTIAVQRLREAVGSRRERCRWGAGA